MQAKIKKHKKFLLVVAIIIVIGLFCGFLYYGFLSDEIKLSISNTLSNYNSFNYNFILKHLIIMSLILVLSFLVIGLPLGFFYLFYESLSVGFLLNIFFATFKLKGLLYIFIYILLNKVLTLVLYIIFLKKIIDIARYVIGLLIYKKDKNLINKIIINFKNSLYIIIFVLIINIALYFLNPVIFKYLAFLLN